MEVIIFHNSLCYQAFHPLNDTPGRSLLLAFCLFVGSQASFSYINTAYCHFQVKKVEVLKKMKG
jgi:hypothetical protein